MEKSLYGAVQKYLFFIDFSRIYNSEMFFFFLFFFFFFLGNNVREIYKSQLA
jgi:hypothetical protein